MADNAHVVVVKEPVSAVRSTSSTSVSLSNESFNNHSVKTVDEEAGSTCQGPQLARDLTNRHVQMLCIGGTIGTGIFLGTGHSLSTGGPASLLLTYAICGTIGYFTLLCLGEMSAYMPIPGSFNAYASRFVDEGFGFALTWNYWFNNATTVAAALVSAEVLIRYWSEDFPAWIISLGFLAIMAASNAVGVKLFGEIEYWLSIFKIIAIQVFLVVGILVNVGVNRNREYIGFKNWSVGDAPFVNGFTGFADVFVSASFAFAASESIGVAAGEAKNPRKNMPKVIKNVVYRIMIFYLIGVFLIGLNIPYNDPNLANGDTFSSPFTLIFDALGLPGAAHVMNAIVLTSVLSAGNEALFSATRTLYAIAKEGQAPRFFGRLAGNQVPLFAMLASTAVGLVCLASSKIGGGTLWVYLQAIVGVSNQIAWVAIGWTSFRFRRAMVAQGKNPSQELPFSNPFYRWSPLFVVVANTCFIIVQGYSSFVPSANELGRFDYVSFISYYIQIPIFFLMWAAWKFYHKTKYVSLEAMDIDTDKYYDTLEDIAMNNQTEPLRKRILNWVL